MELVLAAGKSGWQFQLVERAPGERLELCRQPVDNMQSFINSMHHLPFFLIVARSAFQYAGLPNSVSSCATSDIALGLGLGGDSFFASCPIPIRIITFGNQL